MIERQPHGACAIAFSPPPLRRYDAVAPRRERAAARRDAFTRLSACAPRTANDSFARLFCALPESRGAVTAVYKEALRATPAPVFSDAHKHFDDPT